MQSMRGMIISSNRALVTELDELLTQVTSSLYLRKLPFPDDESNLATMVKAYAPAIIFLDLAEGSRALQLASGILRKAPRVHLVAITREPTRECLLAAVRAGVRDVMPWPLTVHDVHECLSHAFSVVEAEVTAAPNHRQQILSFLPAKPGSGASTVALHTACTMAAFGSARVALMDLDFDSGIVDFLLKLPLDYGLSQVAEFASRMDDAIWSRVVAKYCNLDVLRAGSAQARRRVSTRDMEYILGYARGNYDVMCIDLPGVSDDLHVSVLEQSDSIFIVCTPDLPSIHLVRRRMSMLKEMKLASRVKIIYNRARAVSPLSKSDVEMVLGTEVFAMIENDFAALQKAITNGRPVDPDTPLGRTFTQLVNRIISGDAKEIALVRGENRFWATLKQLLRPAGKTSGLIKRRNGTPLEPEILPPAQGASRLFARQS